MNPENFLTQTLLTQPWGEKITHILAAAINAVDPAEAVRHYLHREGNSLIVGEQVYDLNNYDRIFIVGAGKAGTPMICATVQILGEELNQGIIIVKDQPQTIPASCQIFTAGHPVPDEQGIEATQQIIDLLKNTIERDLVLILISGGGSALLTQPAHGISLTDLQTLTNMLLACGANINEINTLRKHLDIVKGGGLARIAYPATIVTLILSDIVGSPLDMIASGTTVPDPTTFADAYAVLNRYNLLKSVPSSIVGRLQAGISGKIPETPTAEDPIFEKVQNLLIGSNRQAANAALETARQQGFNTLLLTTYTQGEAKVVGRFLAAIAREIVGTGQPIAPPACVIIGGETTVTLCNDLGHGGRNQEMALGAVRDLAGLSNVAIVTLATDGGDGPTDAAGAVVTGETFARAINRGLDLDRELAHNNAYHFFESLGDLLKPGATATNVNDLAFVFVLDFR